MGQHVKSRSGILILALTGLVFTFAWPLLAQQQPVRQGQGGSTPSSTNEGPPVIRPVMPPARNPPVENPSLAEPAANDDAPDNAPAGGSARGFGMGPVSRLDQVESAVSSTPAIPPGPYKLNWDSVRENYKVPTWFRDGKFGVMMHWGPYSVAGYHNEWYQKYIYGNAGIRDFHIKTHGPLDKFGYIKLVDQLGTKFKAEEWADICQKAGATYVIPCAEHHDWFSLWDSDVTPWNSADMGVKRDFMGELAVAVRAKGMKFGVSNHSIEHYTFINQRPPAGMPHDLDDPKLADFYWTQHDDDRLEEFLRLWIRKNFELIDKYQVDMLWFDNGINSRVFDRMKLKVAAYYYNRALQWGKEVTISSKSDAYLAGSILDLERQGRAPTKLTDYVWQPDDPIGETFGYTTIDRGHGDRTQDMAVGRPGTYITRLVQNVSRNGNYLLNISPRGDGTIPDNQQKVLIAIGNWLKINGEAIYGTRPWKVSEEGSVHFTRKGEHLYALPVRAPGRMLQIPILAAPGSVGKVTKVELLGTAGELTFKQDETGLKIDLPESAAENAPFALKISGLSF